MGKGFFKIQNHKLYYTGWVLEAANLHVALVKLLNISVLICTMDTVYPIT